MVAFQSHLLSVVLCKPADDKPDTIRRKLLLVTNRKLHLGFRLIPRSMTLDDRPPLFSILKTSITPTVYNIVTGGCSGSVDLATFEYHLGYTKMAITSQRVYRSK